MEKTNQLEKNLTFREGFKDAWENKIPSERNEITPSYDFGGVAAILTKATIITAPIYGALIPTAYFLLQ